MAEKRLVVTGLQASYTGLFNLREFYATIERWLKDMDYDKEEIKHEVKVYDTGRYVDLVLNPNRSPSDYVKHVMYIIISISNVKDVTITLDGKETMLQEGSITVTMNGMVITDYEGKWVSNPLAYFFRVVVDKYLYSGYIRDLDGMLRDDVKMLYTEISSYLNMNKYRFPVKNSRKNEG